MKKITALQRHPLVIACALAAAGAVLFVSEASYWRSTTTLQELTEMGMSRTQIQTLERSMLDAETGQRGYLLTQRKEYLEPYVTALLRIEDAYKVLDVYYGSDPESQALLQRLHTLTETTLSELALTLQLFDEGRGKAGREILMTDIGREKMDAIRATSAELLAYQTRAVSDSRSALISTLVLDRLGVAVLSLVSLLALFLYLRQSQALKLQQMELQRVVQLERDRLEVEVANRTAELIELAQHLQTAREDERQRLARNLHDDLGSLLTSAKLDAARIKSRITVAAPEALDLLAHLVGTLNTGIALGRRIIEDLRPSSLSNLGLVAALEILAREYAAQSGVAVHCQLEPVALRPSAELVVYRLVQEAITNIAKYAQARNIWIELCTRAGQVEVSVRDDGVGFDTSTKPTSAYGLVGMRFRVGAEGGSLQLQSRPGQGTQILAKFPPLSSTAG